MNTCQNTNKVPFNCATPASVARSGKVAGSSPCFSNSCCMTERVRSRITSDLLLENQQKHKTGILKGESISCNI